MKYAGTGSVALTEAPCEGPSGASRRSLFSSALDAFSRMQAAPLQDPQPPPALLLDTLVMPEFEAHSERLKERARARRDAVTLRAAVLDREDREHASEEEALGRRMPQDEFQGDTNIRTLRALLKMVDERGFERSPHQVRFHDAFERATARVIYRDVSLPAPAHPITTR